MIRDLQRGGSARDAARARERLEEIQAKTAQAEQEAGVATEPAEKLQPIDWQKAKAGDPVAIAGGGRGVLRALPDKRGRVVVNVGSARMTLPAERVGRAEGAPARPAPRPAPPPLREADEGAGHCDLRGLRVDEALDQLGAALDRATADRIRNALAAHGGRRAEAAQELGVDRSTLYRLMKRLGVEP